MSDILARLAAVPLWFWLLAGALVLLPLLPLLPLLIDWIGALMLAHTRALLRRRVRRGTQSAEEVDAIIGALDRFEAATKRKRPMVEGPKDCRGCSPSLRPACRATTEGCVYERRDAP